MPSVRWTSTSRWSGVSCRSSTRSASPSWTAPGAWPRARGPGTWRSTWTDSTTQGEIAPTAPLIAGALAAQVAVVLDGCREIENLQRALATRKTIGMAIGLLMTQYRLREESAFAVLRRRSSHTSSPVREIAARIVTEGSAASLMP